jgi:fructose-1,6-bisphosphatase/inositol monophosphatase family enzyme
MHPLLPAVRRLQQNIRDRIVAACMRVEPDDLARVAHDQGGDTIYAIDRIGEDVLIDAVAEGIARESAVVLIAEGLAEGQIVLPAGTPAEAAVWRVIVDPIDGTRGLMYQKRSAWVLTGVAPNRGPATSLADIELAVQTEIPLVKQHLSDELWATRGAGAAAERTNRLTGERHALRLQPSVATTIAHGFATIARFFPGGRDELAAIDEDMVLAALGPPQPGRAQAFEDQYISSGGQLYELMAGHDRFVADLRPLLRPVLERRGLPRSLCCHPYDLCTELIAREVGVIVTDERGASLRSPLDTETDVGWIGYANAAVRAQIEPALQAALRRRGLLPEGTNS